MCILIASTRPLIAPLVYRMFYFNGGEHLAIADSAMITPSSYSAVLPGFDSNVPIRSACVSRSARLLPNIRSVGRGTSRTAYV